MSKNGLYERIYSVICSVPVGYVTTYGDVARQVGTTARVVGFALAALPNGHKVPWQRVINSMGKVSPRGDGDSSDIQRILLESEGVRFDQQQRVNLNEQRWKFGVLKQRL